MLKYLVTSKTKRSLLRLLLVGPPRPYYLREVARLTGEPLTAVRRELGALEKAGLVRSRREANLLYYEAASDSPLYPELRKIVQATVGLGDYLRDTMAGRADIELAFIYGSVARNEDTPRSDVDLMVVGDIPEPELHTTVSRAEADIGREINYTLMSPAEFKRRLGAGEPFLKRIMAGKKLVLKGIADAV